MQRKVLRRGSACASTIFVVFDLEFVMSASASPAAPSVSGLIELLEIADGLRQRLELLEASSSSALRSAFDGAVGICSDLQKAILQAKATTPREALAQVAVLRQEGDYIEQSRLADFVSGMSSVASLLAGETSDAGRVLKLAPHIPGNGPASAPSSGPEVSFVQALAAYRDADHNCRHRPTPTDADVSALDQVRTLAACALVRSEATAADVKDLLRIYLEQVAEEGPFGIDEMLPERLDQNQLMGICDRIEATLIVAAYRAVGGTFPFDGSRLSAEADERAVMLSACAAA